MQQLIHGAIESAIAFSLKHDSVTQDGLSSWAGKHLRVHLTDWRVDMLMAIDDKGCIKVFAYKEDETVDASITGTLSGFLSVAIKKGDASSLKEAGVVIEGDLSFAQGLQKILVELDIDWEGALASVFGDTLARGIGAGVRELMQFSRRLGNDFEDNLSRYLTAEISLLPTQHEVTSFIKDVTVLRHDVDRLLAKFEGEHHDG